MLAFGYGRFRGVVAASATARKGLGCYYHGWVCYEVITEITCLKSRTLLHVHCFLAHITPGRRKDPFYINMRTPIPQTKPKDP